MRKMIGIRGLPGRRAAAAALLVTAGLAFGSAHADGLPSTCPENQGIKIAAFMKRLPNVTHEQFRDHYEKVHRLIGEKYLKKYTIKYTRKYLTPFPDPVTGNAPPRAYDAVTEIWYSDKAAYDAANAQFSDPAVLKDIMDDVKNFLDLANSPHFFVMECASEVGE